VIRLRDFGDLRGEITSDIVSHLFRFYSIEDSVIKLKDLGD